jgi:hypothetical protein
LSLASPCPQEAGRDHGEAHAEVARLVALHAAAQQRAEELEAELGQTRTAQAAAGARLEAAEADSVQLAPALRRAEELGARVGHLEGEVGAFGKAGWAGQG